MRLVHDKHNHLYADVLLKRRSLYVMNGSARYDYKHEILSNEHSKFDGEVIVKDRRISVICRNEPRPEDKVWLFFCYKCSIIKYVIILLKNVFKIMW